MERGFFEERKLTTNEDASEILSDEDNKKIITFLNKETQRRLSPEYQNDAAEDFLELLEVLFSCLEKKGVSLEYVSAVVSLETGAHLVAKMLQSAIEELKKIENLEDMPTALASSIITRDLYRSKNNQPQDVLVGSDGTFVYSGGDVIIIDDVLNTGESIQKTAFLLENEGVSLDDITAIILAETEDSQTSSSSMNHVVDTIVLDSQDSKITRWITRPEGFKQEPEFHDTGISKDTGKLEPTDYSYYSKEVRTSYEQFIDAEHRAAVEIGRNAALQFYQLHKK